MTKYLRPSRYLLRAWRLYYERFLHDPGAIEGVEDQKFAVLGFDRGAALARLDPILQRQRGHGFDWNTDSIHWILFSALASLSDPPRNILEIGTSDGAFTALLAELFPEAFITTVDLPPGDPLVRRMTLYRGATPAAAEAYETRQHSNTRRRNVRLLQMNSYFLPEKLGATRFDAVWVDGGHLYPEIAWDLCNAFHLSRPGAWIVCDDVLSEVASYRDEYVSTDSFEVIRYVQARAPIQPILLLKRRAAVDCCLATRRKYVACFVRPDLSNV